VTVRWRTSGESVVAVNVRLLQVLESLNEIGSCTIVDVHRATGISRPAIYRIVSALVRSGYLQRIPGDSRVRLTWKVRTLSAGYRDDDWIVEAANPVLAQLQKEVRWPSSLAIPDRDKMVVRETNRHRSPFVFDSGSVGLHLPMLRSSLGLAYLAFCERRTRMITLALLRGSKDRGGASARDRKESERQLRNTAQRGYGFRQGGIEARTSSVAVPVLIDSEALASICVTYATSALTLKSAATQFLPLLRAAAKDIAASAPSNRG
jgi:IclR family transcriptional regulator, mhp operon transcriptional activator